MPTLTAPILSAGSRVSAQLVTMAMESRAVNVRSENKKQLNFLCPSFNNFDCMFNFVLSSDLPFNSHVSFDIDFQHQDTKELVQRNREINLFHVNHYHQGLTANACNVLKSF